MPRRYWKLVVLLLAACGAPSRATTDAPTAIDVDASPDASSFVEAPHGSAPQVRDRGGPVLANPRVVPIFFAGDAAMQAQVEGFLHALAASSYWHATTSEYGIGDLVIEPSIVASDAPFTTTNELEDWLRSRFDGTHPEWTYNASAIYAVYLPDGVQLSNPAGVTCQAFNSYHLEVAGNPKIIYAVMARCAGGLDQLTVSSSHEFIEASSDPFSFTQGAYQELDAEHEVMLFTPGPELGDMCQYLPTAAQRIVDNYRVQRTWSNLSAAAGHDPCVPTLSTPYRGAAPITHDDVIVGDGLGFTVMTKGVKVPMGTPQTIDVVLFSDAPTEAFPVSAVDVAGSVQGQTPELSFSWDRTSGQNGDTLHLTITRLKNGAGGSSEFMIAVGEQDAASAQWWAAAGN
jgi:hypothetical protein